MSKLYPLIPSVGLILTFGPSVLAQENQGQDVEVISVTEVRNEVLRFGSNARSQLLVQEGVGNPMNLVALLDGSPGVARNGQNGLFQVFSVRGVAGQRVQTRFNSMPISTERRAGTAAAFIDPWFLQQVQVIRGPASTFFGSGAMGGVVQFQPRQFSGLQTDVGYEYGGTQRSQSLGWGHEDWSIALSNRSAADGEDPQGNALNTNYDQSSLMLTRRWRAGNLDVSGLLLSSRGRDIGRSNTLFPQQRIVDVDSDDHDVVQLDLSSNSLGQVSLYAHKYQTDTESLIPAESLSVVENSSMDYGFHWNQNWKRGSWSGQLGTEVDARDSVEARESQFSLDGDRVLAASNLDGRQRIAGLYSTATYDASRFSLQFGLRHTWLRQAARSQADQRENDFSGFIGLQWYLDPYWTVSAEVATAFRLPSLTERFFNGTTARGRSIGNPALTEEDSRGIDLGIHWRRGQDYFDAHVYSQNVDDYIERINLDPFTRGFENRRRGRLDGLEFEGRWHPRQQWAVTVGAYWIEGESEDGNALADVPPAMLSLGFAYSGQRWEAGVDWNFRFDKTDVADTELSADRANLVSAYYRHRIGESTVLSAYAGNLLNDSYRIAADDIATLANRRIVGVRLNHRFF